MATNKAVVVTKFDVENPGSNLVVEDIGPMPQPGPDQLVVRLSLRPINPADIFSIMGVYPGFQPSPNLEKIVPGLEGMGTVAAVGEGVSEFSVGQRVTGCPFDTIEHGQGTWQEYIVANADSVVAVPDAVSDESAAQFWVNPATTYGMLEELSIPKGEYLLQTAAGSVLGRQVIQLAKHQGIKTINVVRREGLVQELLDFGADHVIVSESGEGLQEKVMEITGGKGAYAAIEAVGGSLFAATASSVRNSGTCMIYGAMSGLEASFSIPDPLFRNVTIKGFWVVHWKASKSPEDFKTACANVMKLLEKGIITPYSGKIFPLDSVQQAVAEATSSARGGKVLLA